MNNLPPGLHFDESRNLLRVWRIANDYGVPDDLEDIPEPFDTIARGIYAKFAGDDPFTIKLFSSYLGVIAVAATIGVARVLYRRSANNLLIVSVAGLTLAVMPASVMINRAIYRATWVTPATALFLWSYLWGFYTHRPKYFILAGVFCAMGAMMYLGGLFLIPAALIVLLLMPPGRRGFILFVAAFSVMMLPWLYLYLTVPNWLSVRVSNLDNGSITETLTSPQVLASRIEQIVHFLVSYVPTNPVYSPDNTGLLNILLAVLFVIGSIYSLFKRQWMLIAVLVILLLAPLLTVTPTEAIRYTGAFVPIALLTGAGIQLLMIPRRVAYGLIVIAVPMMTLYTWSLMQDHFDDWQYGEAYYFATIHQQAEFLLEAETPVYMPVDYLDYPIMAGYLLTGGYKVRGYDESFAVEDLPQGILFDPVDGSVGSPYVDQPYTAYAALYPQEHIIQILPLMPPDVTAEIVDYVQSNGSMLPDAIGKYISVDDPQMLFKTMVIPEIEQSLVVIDENLELVSVDVPDVAVAGEWLPVTLNWRLRHETSKDYVALFQVWNVELESFGRQHQYLSNIFPSLSPTSTWEAGTIMSERRWVQIYPETVDGGYYVVGEVFTPRGDSAYSLSDKAWTALNWVVVDRVTVGELPESDVVDESLELVFESVIGLEQIDLSAPLDTLQAGDMLEVTLHWSVDELPVKDYLLFMHVFDEDNNLLMQFDGRPSAMYPTNTWHVGSHFITQHQMTLPEDGGKPYRMALGMYVYQSPIRAVLRRNGEQLTDDIFSFIP